MANERTPIDINDLIDFNDSSRENRLDLLMGALKKVWEQENAIKSAENLEKLKQQRKELREAMEKNYKEDSAKDQIEAQLAKAAESRRTLNNMISTLSQRIDALVETVSRRDLDDQDPAYVNANRFLMSELTQWGAARYQLYLYGRTTQLPLILDDVTEIWLDNPDFITFMTLNGPARFARGAVEAFVPEREPPLTDETTVEADLPDATHEALANDERPIDDADIPF